MTSIQGPQFGVLQQFVDRLFQDREELSRLDVVLEAEACDLGEDLLEIINLLPPGTYSRIRLCSQLNSALSSHNWGYYYGSVY